LAGPDDWNPYRIDAPVVTLLGVGDTFPPDLGHFLEETLRTADGIAGPRVLCRLKSGLKGARRPKYRVYGARESAPRYPRQVIWLPTRGPLNSSLGERVVILRSKECPYAMAGRRMIEVADAGRSRALAERLRVSGPTRK
jgi:hypothetical protein